jgi:hypothetical protein
VPVFTCYGVWLCMYILEQPGGSFCTARPRYYFSASVLTSPTSSPAPWTHAQTLQSAVCSIWECLPSFTGLFFLVLSIAMLFTRLFLWLPLLDHFGLNFHVTLLWSIWVALLQLCHLQQGCSWNAFRTVQHSIKSAHSVLSSSGN